jgi:hypothetical protein
MNPIKSPTAGIPNQILNSAVHDDRPAGVSLLDSMVHQYEKQTGRKSALPAETVAKLESKLTESQLNTAQRLIRNSAGIHKQADAREAIQLLDVVLQKLAAKPTPAPAPAKSATAAPQPTATAGGTVAGERPTASAPQAAATDKPSLYSFIRNGKLPAGTAEADLRDMLKLARDLIQSYRETTSPAAAPDGLISAEQFAGPPPPRMLKSEFDKLTDSNKSRYIRQGGKLAPDAKPARR